MRTTVTIDDRLLDLAKRRAHEQHTTLGAVVSEALQRHLSVVSHDEVPPLPVVGGGGMRPGIDPRSNHSLREAMEDEPDRETG